MKALPDATWFDERTLGAPAALRDRAATFFAQSGGRDLPERLAQAGDYALCEATRSGATRPAALDLLAADALITLALLAHAERDPAALGAAAAMLREQMAQAHD